MWKNKYKYSEEKSVFHIHITLYIMKILFRFFICLHFICGNDSLVDMKVEPVTNGNQEEILAKLSESVSAFDIDGIKKIVIEAIEAGIPAYKAVMEGLSKGMDIVSERYTRGESFLSELILAGEAMKVALTVLEPYLKASPSNQSSVVVLGTVYGDMHDLGANLVAILLKSAGFEVISLGVDVPSEKFVDAVREENADILALSSLVTTTMPEMSVTVDALVKAGLRKNVKVLVGGAPLSSAYAESIGADAYGKDAVSAVEICKKFMENR